MVRNNPPALITGRRFALIVGINYVGTSAQLQGCVWDAKNMSQFLGSLGYSITLLVDENVPGRVALPTKDNIVNYLTRLIRSLRPGDSLFFHYSGHGSNRSAPGKPEEIDGRDECICPLDFQRAGMIWDDDIRKMLNMGVKGSRITMLSDSCHSGTIADLPVVPSIPNRAPISSPNADIIVISTCLDPQTAADAFLNNQPVGAGTNAFLASVKPITKLGTEFVSNKTILQLIKDMRAFMVANRFSQIPTLSYSRTFPENTRFSL